MRRLGYLLLFALALAALGPVLLEFAPRLIPAAALKGPDQAWKLELAREAAVSLAYEVDGAGVRFPLPPGTRRLKLVTHASFADIARLRQQQLEDPARRWSYAVEITLVGEDGAILLRREHHFRSNLTEWVDPRGRRLTAVYLLDDSATPSNGSLLHLDLAGLPAVAAVELRRLSMDPEASALMARAYAPEPIPERRLGTLWQRLHDRQKARLARGNVYAPELLLEEEKRNLLRQLWQPLAPRGAREVDFRVRELYVLRELEGERVEPEVAPVGLILGAGHRVTLAIPEAGGDFRFEFTALEELAGEHAVALTWFGPGVFDERRLSARGSGPSFSWEARLEGGLVELESTRGFALRVFQAGTPDIEITPPPLYTRAYLASAGEAVDYALAHEGQAATPLRLALRRLLADGRSPASGARYEFRDAAGGLLAEGTLALEAAPSAYDSAVSELAGTVLGEAREFYFLAPAGAARLSLHAVGEGAVLVALSSRPPQLPRLVRVPEDRFEQGLDGERVPAWFGVRPRDYERRVLEHRSRLLAVQARPPERESALLGGDYRWQDYRPEGEWLARVLFAPRDGDSPMREDALPSTFSPLPANRVLERDFPRYHGQDVLVPTLVWLADGAPEVKLAIYVDDLPAQSVRGRGAFGQARLLPLAHGRHRIRVEAPRGVRLYLNHHLPLGEARSRRLAQRLRGPLRFEYLRDTTAAEFLTARLFQQGGGGRRATLSIELEGPPVAPLAAQEHWLFERRTADVRADDSVHSPVFNTAGERVDAGRPVFIPFPEGAPAGRYRIAIEAQGAAPGEALYLTLSRIAAAPATSARAHLEARLGDAAP